jgi:protein subunit release factor A
MKLAEQLLSKFEEADKAPSKAQKIRDLRREILIAKEDIRDSEEYAGGRIDPDEAKLVRARVAKEKASLKKKEDEIKKLMKRKTVPVG